MEVRAEARRSTILTRLRQSDYKHEWILLLLLAAIFVVMSFLNARFLTIYNLFEMSRNYVEIGLLALPLTLIIITGGNDLSVGSIVGVCAIVTGIAFQSTGSMVLAIALCLATGAVCGLFNGFLVGQIKMAPMVATLATLYLFRGVALGVSEARSYVGFPKWFQFFGLGSVGVLPVQTLIFIVAAIAFAVLLHRTDIGRYVMAIGNNENAVRYSGANVRRIKYFLFLASGMISAVTALIFISRITMSKANAGEGYEMDAITMVVLGGTDINGGRGTVAGTVLGVLIIGVLRNALTLMRVPSETQNVIIGAILIGSILVKNATSRESRKL